MLLHRRAEVIKKKKKKKDQRYKYSFINKIHEKYSLLFLRKYSFT